MLLLLFISLLFCGNFDFSVGQCNKCDSAGIACLTKNSFHMCIADKVQPSMGIFTCADDTVCVSNNPARCLPSTSIASCGATCKICNQVTFASCTDHKNFTLCTGTVPSDVLVGTCPIGFICNSQKTDICVPETSDDGATCPLPITPEEPPTIEPPHQPTNPIEFCLVKHNENIRFPRKFPAPENCRRYNYCAINNSKVEGYQYVCPGKLEFNCQRQSCGQICVKCVE